MRVGLYECDITPPLGCFLPGHYTDMRAEDVYDMLYAKAVVFENNGKTAALVSVDTCEIPNEMHDVVTERITQYTGIPMENVCIVSTHSHTGAPVTDDAAINCFADNEYKSVFFRRVADAVILAYKRLRECNIKFVSTDVENVAFNRNYVLKDGSLGSFKPVEEIASSLSGTDPSVSALVFEKDGEKLGALLNFACHQDTVCPPVPGYSGDYSSEISNILREEYGNSFVSVFTPGACGDINHVDYKNPASVIGKFFIHRRIGKMLANAIISAMPNAVDVSGELDVAKEKMMLKKRKLTFEQFKDVMGKFLEKDNLVMRIRNLAVYQDCDLPDYTEVCVQAVRIGDFCIYALPGEIFVDFGLEIKKRTSYEKCMVIENCNTFCGYIPTEKAFSENSDLYEISPCLDSCHMPDSGNKIMEKALALGERLNKK